MQKYKAVMPKKNPNTATGGKRKRTTRNKKDLKYNEVEPADLEKRDTEKSRSKRRKPNVLPNRTTSTQTSPHASTSKVQFPEEGRFTHFYAKTIPKLIFCTKQYFPKHFPVNGVK